MMCMRKLCKSSKQSTHRDMASKETPIAKRPRIEKRQFLSAWKTISMGYSQSYWRYALSILYWCWKEKCLYQRLWQIQDALAKHALTVDHRAAIEAKSCWRDMQLTLAYSYRDQEKAVIAALKTVYFMAKNLPNDHFSDIKQFCWYRGLVILVPSVFSVAVGDDNLPMNTAKVLGGFKKLLLPLTRI